MTSKFNFLFLLIFPLFDYAQGQNSVSTTGGTIESTTGNVSYSVGQVFYNNLSDAGGSFSQGVIQIEELPNKVLESKEHSNDFPLSLYPNPTVNNITISWKKGTESSIHYLITNQNGQVLRKGFLDSMSNQIDMTNLPASVYYISIFINENQRKNFKIVRSN